MRGETLNIDGVFTLSQHFKILLCTGNFLSWPSEIHCVVYLTINIG
jgi:hypothetical protein